MERVGIFVDVQNIYYTVKQCYQRHFNYQVFWDHMAKDRHIAVAIAYAIDRNDSKQQSFQQILRNIGFTVKLKPYIQRSDGSAKGDWDVGITLDIIDYAPQLDTVVLLSGDGDFDMLLNKLNNRYTVNTEVYGVPSLTAPSLINAATRFIAIDHKLLL
jgi:uncharacterized LabA/DUF88 family protein